MAQRLSEAMNARWAGVWVIEYVKHEKLRLLVVDIVEPCHDVLEVTIDQAPRCDPDCTDFNKNIRNGSSTWVHCKHVYGGFVVGFGGDGLHRRGNGGGSARSSRTPGDVYRARG